MITCKLGDQKFSVDFISGRALREIEPASSMYGKLVRMAQAAASGESVAESEDGVTIPEALDVMVQWFCLLFGGQFTPDDMYDKYPVDRLMHDIALALMTVQSQTTSVLGEFPTIPVTQAAENLTKTKKAPKNP